MRVATSSRAVRASSSPVDTARLCAADRVNYRLAMRVANFPGDAAFTARAAEFKQALRTHFSRLAELQARARTLSERSGGPTPVAPDLWLLVNGEHRFIEVKLPGDRRRAPQYAGLALLAAHLPSARPIAVSVITLESSEDQFATFARSLRR